MNKENKVRNYIQGATIVHRQTLTGGITANNCCIENKSHNHFIQNTQHPTLIGKQSLFIISLKKRYFGEFFLSKLVWYASNDMVTWKALGVSIQAFLAFEGGGGII